MKKVHIKFKVSSIALCYTLQRRGMVDFKINYGRWREIFLGKDRITIEHLNSHIKKNHIDDFESAKKNLKKVETKWKEHEDEILSWLSEITKLYFKCSEVQICIVSYPSGVTPFVGLPIIIVGKIRKGWDYLETISHELTHILFDQNSLIDDFYHPYIQLVEEEIALRLGVRKKYFDYEIPEEADWIKRAKSEKKRWDFYLQHRDNFEDISYFIKKEGV